MSSTSDSEYVRHCKALVLGACERPAMYFERLDEFEAMLTGHGTAFIQLGQLHERGRLFNTEFRKWLWQEKRLSCASGWSRAIREVADAEGDPVVPLAIQLLKEFAEQW